MKNQISDATYQIEKKLNCFYSIISGRAGEKRNWEKFSALFAPNANLSTVISAKDVMETPIIWSVESYIERLVKFLGENDFFEIGYDYKIQYTTNIAQVTSKYMAKKTEADVQILKQGTNSIHLVKLDDEWKIISMLWEDY